MTSSSLLLFLCVTMTIVPGPVQQDNVVTRIIELSEELEIVSLIDHLANRSDSRVRPGVLGGPTTIYISFYLRSFGRLDAGEMDFSVDIDFRQTWIDRRLRFDLLHPDTPVFVPFEHTGKFWVPDVYFPNQKDTVQHFDTVPNKSFRIYPNGTVRYVSRIAMDLSCTMYLERFPFDEQECSIKISTYAHDTRSVELQWEDDDPIEMYAKKLNLPQFAIMNYRPQHCKEEYKAGNFSCLEAAFRLKRKIGFFVLHSYVPSILIVMLSWVGFWINKNSDPARVSLGVTTVLTMTTIATSAETVPVAYMKALDVWFAMCMVFVFGALLEYAFINEFVRTEKKMSDHGPAASTDPEAVMSAGSRKETENGAKCNSKRECLQQINAVRIIRQWKITSQTIDHTSRRVFPICFAAFCVVYYLTYTVFTA